ncbi:MAG: hypothetical protein P9X22_09300 [Candidatus Zapsychrus exili]|nr:hypothetical protein [Candidatus Zapsychrus exili]
MRKLKEYLYKHPKAQTAIELAVFGAILIFVLGAIIKQTLGFSYAQNQGLKSMRMAMTMSLKNSFFGNGYPQGGEYDDTGIIYGNSSRNSASVLLVEDRLTAGSAKHGTVDRVPHMSSGAGTFSINLFMPLDDEEDVNIPILDVYVNGKHFPFQMAKFKTVEFPVPDNPDAEPGDDDYDYDRGYGWDKTCYLAEDPVSSLMFDVGCARIYTFIPNHLSMRGENGSGMGKDRWCSTSPCPDIRTVDEAFDLDRDFRTSCSGCPEGSEVLPEYRESFAWQWYGVKALNEDKDFLKKVEDDHFMMAAFLDGGTGVNLETGLNLMVDVDGDWQEEFITKILKTSTNTDKVKHDAPPEDENYDPEKYRRWYGQIEEVRVLDYQEGDLNFSTVYKNYNSANPKPGFTRDVAMYTFISATGDGSNGEGTYLSIEEGQLFDGDEKRYIRNVQRKDQIDLISRTMQLSNNTGRFCGTSPLGPMPGGLELIGLAAGEPNPVDVCCINGACNGGGSSCFSDETIAHTCMDLNGTATGPVIYVRSRIADLRGKKWITNTSEDDYIEFAR